MISDNGCKNQEDHHVRRVLRGFDIYYHNIILWDICYPDWKLKKVNGQLESAKEKKYNKKRQQSDQGDRPQVVITYVENGSETVARVLRKHQVPVAIRSVNTLTRMFVHSKDKQANEEKLNVCIKLILVNATTRMWGRQAESLG